MAGGGWQEAGGWWQVDGGGNYTRNLSEFREKYRISNKES